MLSKPKWWNTVESRDLVGLSPEDQQRQIAAVKELNEWNAYALKRIKELEDKAEEDSDAKS